MRKSRAITLTVLAGLMLTCCIAAPSCFHSEPDRTWYDENGNAIEEKWQTDANGNKMLDAEGRPIPSPHVPYDRHHRPWVFVGGVWGPPVPPMGTRTSSYSSPSRSSSSWGSSSSYRSFSSGSSSSTSSPSRTSTSTPSRSSSSPSTSSPSSVSRGGFGTTGAGSSSSSSS
jgi:hypothetical protein